MAIPKEPAGRLMTKRFEGFRDTVYKDTKGKRTIGYGFNLDDAATGVYIPKEASSGKRKLTKAEADVIFPKLYDRASKDAGNFAGAKRFKNLSEGQRNVLIDMAYNMGAVKLSGFKKMQAALQKGDYKQASKEIENSNYYKQTGNRAKNNVAQILQ